MSLESGGCTFKAKINLTHVEQYLLTPHIYEEKLNHEYEFENYQPVVKGKTYKDRTKEAFMKAMEEFANSPTFEALTYRLENNFTIQIHHNIHTKMNS